MKDKFQLILAKNIELAYRMQVPTPGYLQTQYQQALVILKSQGYPSHMLPLEPVFYQYFAIKDENMTLKDLIEEQRIWPKEQCSKQLIEQKNNV